MADKIMGIVGVVLIALLAIGVLFFLLQPLIWSDEYAEWVIYVRVALLLQAIGTFAQLRLFNAIVKNSLFVIRLRETIHKLSERIPLIDRGMTTLRSSITGVKSSVDSLNKSINLQADATEKLSEKIEQFKFNQKIKKND